MAAARCIRDAISFFTVIPVRGSGVSCAWAAPYVAAPIIGGVGALVLAATHRPELAYIAMVVVTGLHHLDGLADTADALMVRDVNRAREVLEDPHRGVAGIFAVVAAAAVTIEGMDEPLELLASEVFSKALVVVLAAFSKPFKPGMGQAFIESARRTWPIAIPALVVIALIYPAETAAASVVSALLYAMPYRHLGGANGDVLGWTLELSRTAFIALA